MATNNVDLMVKQFLFVRDGLDKLKAEYDEKKKELTGIRDLLTGKLLAVMEKTNTTSLRSPHGTATLSVKYTASLTDPDAFMKHVKETQNFELLDRRANATAVVEYIRHHGEKPPGTNLSEWRSVGVRIPTQKPE